MARLQILTEGVEAPILNWDSVEEWIREVVKTEGYRLGQLTYIFCDDKRILEVNRQFINHDYFTDIITFDYTAGKRISGDLYISLDTVKSNAELFAVPYETELHRVIIHGVLHLCGINDKGPGEREIMERHENAALSLLKK